MTNAVPLLIHGSFQVENPGLLDQAFGWPCRGSRSIFHSPPALLLYGGKDPLLRQSLAYWEKAANLGVRSDKFIAEDQKHGFFNTSPWYERTLIAADRFLISLGFLKGKPTVQNPKDR